MVFEIIITLKNGNPISKQDYDYSCQVFTNVQEFAENSALASFKSSYPHLASEELSLIARKI